LDFELERDLPEDAKSWQTVGPKDAKSLPRDCFLIPSMSLNSRQRLRRRKEFEIIRTQGKKAVWHSFILQIMLTEPTISSIRRLGVIASKRVGNAINRNRAKRILREIFRLNQEVLPPCCDVVLIARKKIFNHSFQELQKDYRSLCKRMRKRI
jgi:ribonuclease P protein component